MPSGALVPEAKLHIGAGTVVALDGLIAELDALAKIGVDTSRITISDRAQIVFPFHATLDQAAERARGGAAIGTTGRGIGPAYVDRRRARRRHLRRSAHAGDPGRKIRYSLLAKAALFAGAGGLPREEDVVGRNAGRRPTAAPARRRRGRLHQRSARAR